MKSEIIKALKEILGDDYKNVKRIELNYTYRDMRQYAIYSKTCDDYVLINIQKRPNEKWNELAQNGYNYLNVVKRYISRLEIYFED